MSDPEAIDDALREVRESAVRIAIAAYAWEQYPATPSSEALRRRMAERFAAEVMFLRDDLAVLGPVRKVGPRSWWRRVARGVAVWLWRVGG